MQQSAGSGLFPLNTFKRKDDSILSLALNSEDQRQHDMPTLPYFDSIRRQASKIIKFYK